MLTVTLPIRAHSTLNEREHWSVRARRAKAHRDAAAWILKGQKVPPLPCVVTLTRVGPRVLDTDNLAASLKNVRDGVADWLSVDDGDARVSWRYAQRKGDYFVEVQVK